MGIKIDGLTERDDGILVVEGCSCEKDGIYTQIFEKQDDNPLLVAIKCYNEKCFHLINGECPEYKRLKQENIPVSDNLTRDLQNNDLSLDA